MPGFDADAARQAGYSDDEILAHLAGKHGFDPQAAIGAGFEKRNVIDHLASGAPLTHPAVGIQAVPASAGPQAIDTQPDARASLSPEMVDKVNRLRAASHAMPPVTPVAPQPSWMERIGNVVGINPILQSVDEFGNSLQGLTDTRQPLSDRLGNVVSNIPFVGPVLNDSAHALARLRGAEPQVHGGSTARDILRAIPGGSFVQAPFEAAAAGQYPEAMASAAMLALPALTHGGAGAEAAPRSMEVPPAESPRLFGATQQPVRPPANSAVADIANSYNAQRGMPPIEHPTALPPINEDFSRAVAKAYDRMSPDNSADPNVAKAYSALGNEINDQWNHATANGIKMEPWTQEGQPYANSTEMANDVANNRHLYFFQGGEPHPLLGSIDPQTGLSLNDKFRAVHDLFGHVPGGNGFGPQGETAATNAHRQMFSPDATKAMITETLGQNSWVNFGDHNYDADGNHLDTPLAQRPYAQQKVGLLPPEYMTANPDARRVSFGLDTGEGTPLRNSGVLTIPQHIADSVLNEIATRTGVGITGRSSGLGAYLGSTEPSTHLHVVGSAESIDNFMHAAGHALQQTEVISSRPSLKGNGFAFDVIGDGLGTDTERARFYGELKKKMGDAANDIIPGFQPIQDGGKPGLRFLKFDGPMDADTIKKLRSAVEATENSRDYDVNIKHSPIEIKSTSNNWSEQPNGEDYLSRITQAGRPDLSGWLDSEHRGALGQRLEAERNPATGGLVQALSPPVPGTSGGRNILPAQPEGPPSALRYSPQGIAGSGQPMFDTLQPSGISQSTSGLARGLFGEGGTAVRPSASSWTPGMPLDEITPGKIIIPGTGPGGKLTVPDVASHLNKQIRRALGAIPADASPKRKMARLMDLGRTEMADQMQKPDSGANWYSEDTKKADADMISAFPELKDPRLMAFQKAISAVMSNNSTPEQEAYQSARIYQQFRDTGKLPPLQPNGKEWPAQGASGQLSKIQSMVDQMGVPGFVDFISRPQSVADIRQWRPGQEGKASDLVPGSLVLGPKVGRYWMDVMGQEHEGSAVDKWDTRAQYRRLGRLMDSNGGVPDSPDEADRPAFMAMHAALAQENGLSRPSAAQSVLWHYEKDLYRRLGLNVKESTRSQGTGRFIKEAKGKP